MAQDLEAKVREALSVCEHSKGTGDTGVVRVASPGAAPELSLEERSRVQSGENRDLKCCRGGGGAGWWLRMTGLRPGKEARAQVGMTLGTMLRSVRSGHSPGVVRRGLEKEVSILVDRTEGDKSLSLKINPILESLESMVLITPDL